MNEVQEKIQELQNKIVAVCLGCPHAKWSAGFYECKVGRRHCHSVRVKRWLDEIERLEGKK